MYAMTANVAASVKDSPTAPRLLTGTGKDDGHLFIVCTAERGLCGGFNTQIVRRALSSLNELDAQGKSVKILTVGRKGRDQLRRLHGDRFVGHVDLSEGVNYERAAEIAQDVRDRFDKGEFDVCTLFYSKFKSVISQEPTPLALIPPDLPEENPAEGTVYDYEPDEEAILSELLPKNMATQIFMALLENAASEQGARMAAMDNATRNAGEMIDRLNLDYNRARQAAITNELIEIISGAEAL
jgi:F-type H+-transporting ATPase subunit gamma